MTTVLPRSSQEQQGAPACASLSSFPDLSTLSTLWVPLHEVRQQVLSWLDLAGNDHRQQDPESLQMIRTLMAQVQWHQGRRRALHQQVLGAYIEAKQHKQQQRAQQDSQHRTGHPASEREEEV